MSHLVCMIHMTNQNEPYTLKYYCCATSTNRTKTIAQLKMSSLIYSTVEVLFWKIS